MAEKWNLKVRKRITTLHTYCAEENERQEASRLLPGGGGPGLSRGRDRSSRAGGRGPGGRAAGGTRARGTLSCAVAGVREPAAEVASQNRAATVTAPPPPNARSCRRVRYTRRRAPRTCAWVCRSQQRGSDRPPRLTPCQPTAATPPANSGLRVPVLARGAAPSALKIRSFGSRSGSCLT